MATVKQEKPTEKATTPLYDEVWSDYEAARDYAGLDEQRRKDNWKLWNNERVLVGYSGTTDTFVPLVTEIVETMVANVWGSLPKWNYTPTCQYQNKDTKLLNALAEQTWECNKLDQVMITYGREVEVSGDAYLVAGWEGDGIKTKHFPASDCYVDPNCGNDFDEATKFFVKFEGDVELMKKEQVVDIEATRAAFDAYDKQKQEYDVAVASLQEGIEPPQAPEMPDPVMKLKYKNLDALEDTQDQADQTTKQKDDALKGSNTNGSKGKHNFIRAYYIGVNPRIIEIATGGKQVVYEENNYPFQKAASKKVIITNQDGQHQEEDVDVPEIKPFLPVIPQRAFQKPGRFYARSTVDIIKERQELLNDTENMDADAAQQDLKRKLFVDPMFKDQLQKIATSKPGSAHAVPPGAVKWQDPPVNNGRAQERKRDIIQSMRSATGADEVTGGASPDIQSTATQINAQMAQFGVKAQTRIKGVENECYDRMGRIFLWMWQIFMTEKQMVRCMDRAGINFEEFDASRFWGMYEPRVQLEQTVKSKQELDAKRAQDLYALGMNDPFFNQLELRKFVLDRGFQLEPDEADKLLAQPGDMESSGLDPRTGQPVMQDPSMVDPNMDPSMQGAPPTPPVGAGPMPPAEQQPMSAPGMK